MEGTAGNLWKLAYDLCSHEQVEQERSAQPSVCRASNGGNHPDQCGGTIPRPTGKLKDAVTYAQNQKAHLCAFLEHGEIEISNNQVENAIRPFVVGRKGWLFADTPQGAEASAIIYSLMETAKANSLRLDDYLLHLLSILPERTERNKDFEIDDLLPWSEEMKSWFSAV